MNNYSEQIFQSIDTIISQRLNEVKFDRTITCEVIAGVKDYPNKYWVSDGATKFQACVVDSSRTYIAGQKVYVLIPNGDYNSADKVIIGSYTADELPKNLYTNPFDHLVYSSKVLFGPALDKYIETSVDTENLISIGEQGIVFNFSNTTPFDYVGLDFSFNTTDLQGMKKGNYGIQFTLKNNDVEIFTSAIDSSQLYGNIYNFNSLMKMQHLFPIPTDVDITQANKLVVNLYQKGNFDISKKKIYLNEATFYFGYDVEKIDRNKLILHLDKTESLVFKDNEKRNFYLEWQDTDLNKIYTSSKNDAPAYKYEIYWCHYEVGYKKIKEDDIEETGVYWRTLIKNKDFEYQAGLKKDNQREQFKVGIKYYDEAEEIEKLKSQQKQELKAIDEDTALTDKEEKKKIINEKYQNWFNSLQDYINNNNLWKYLESNVLIFTNEDVKPEPGSTNNSEDSIKLTCSDSGVYNYYTSYGKIIDSKYKNLERTITASFLDGYDIADTTTNVKWSIVGIDETNQKSTMINQKAATNNLFTFTIKDNYIPGIKDQNTILCEATLSNGEIRRGKITLRFGEANSAGSQYAFNIDFPDNVNCLYIGDTTPIEMKYTFESRSGEKIEEPTIIWSWLDDTDHGDIILNANAGTLIAPNIMPTQNHAVLVATIEDYPLSNGLQTHLKAYLPIPLSADRNKYQYMSGPTYLVYDSTGSAVLNYSKENYVLYPTDDSETWRAEDYTPNTPQLSFKKDKWYLQPLALAPNNLPVACLKAIKDPAGDNVIIWSQPIFSTRERWDMDALNDWNGTFLQDIEKNRLFAATIAAGGKNAEDNTFSGVLMGQSLDSTNKTLEETGLYGIDKGIVKYYLNNAGAFFVGDGDNYISFNDINKGTKDTNGNATFAVNVNKLLLNTPQTKIISSKPTSSVSDTADLRVKLGWIKDEVYGLDIYNGAFKMYGVPWKEGLTDEDANIYFLQNNDTGKIDMAINGAFNRLVPIQWSLPEGTTRPYQTEINGTLVTIIDSYGTNFNNIIPNTTFFSGLSAGLYGQIKYQFLSTSPLFTINIPDNKKQQFILGTTFRAISTAKENLLRNVLCSNGINLEIFCKPDSSILTDDPTIEIYTSTGSEIEMSKNILNINCNNYYETARYDYQASVQLNSNHITLSVYSGNMQVYPNISLYADASDYTSNISITAKNVYTEGTWSGSVSGGTTSDSQYKNSITELSAAYSILFDNLTPKRFKYNDGTSNRFHTGFIAQDVNEAVKNSGLTTQDFAATILLNKGKENEHWALRYEEFIALNTWQIQKLKQRVTELENEIKEIKQNENN